MAHMPDRPDDSLGDLLRTARERRGLTVQDLAAITRIPLRHLDALERGQLDELPGGMYRRAEVRTYAETVGLDKALALERLEQSSLGLAADPVPVTPAAPMYDPSPRSRIYAVIVTVGLIAAAATTYWWWRQPAISADTTAAALDAARVARSTAAPDVAPAPDVTPTPRDATAAAHTTAPAPAPAVASAVATPELASTETVAAPVDDLALTVTSSPSGARVLIDGIGYGQTPITIRHLQPGQRRVRLVLDGFVSAEQPLRLSPSRPATLDVTLDRSP